MSRLYEPVWERIKKYAKESKAVTLEVEPGLVARVKKAVIKEKHIDLGFKILNDHDNFFLEIVYEKTTKRLRFKLKQTLGLEGIKS